MRHMLSGQGQSLLLNFLNLLPAAEAGGPGPLKIVAAEMAGDVNNFADEI